jgi:hypothetical protein
VVAGVGALEAEVAVLEADAFGAGSLAEFVTGALQAADVSSAPKVRPMISLEGVSRRKATRIS